MATIPHPSHLDFMDVGELRNFRVQVLATDPTTLYNGRVWYNSTDHVFKLVNDGSVDTFTTVTALNTAIANMVTRAANSAGAGVLTVSGGADRSLDDYSGTAGLVKVDATGVVSTAVAGTDYITPAGTVTLTNKTISGADNTVTNLPFSALDSTAVSTDIATDPSATKVARADAVKTYVDNRVTAMGEQVGTLDASTDTLPTTGSGASGAIVKGDYWLISVAGTITGVGALEVGDALFAATDDASLAGDFFALQNNVANPVSSTGAASTALAIPIYDDTSGMLLKPSAILTEADGSFNLPAGASYKIDGVDISSGMTHKFAAAFDGDLDWVGTSAPYTYTVTAATHGLGATEDLQVQVKDSSGVIISVETTTAATGDVTISSLAKFAGRIVIIG